MEEQLVSIVKSLNEIKGTQNKLIQSINKQNKTINIFIIVLTTFLHKLISYL